MKMVKRISTIVGIAILFGGIMLNKYLANQRKPPERNPQVKGVKLVRTLPVNNGTIQAFVSITGKLVASQKMAVVSEVPGKLLATNPPFKEGNRFAKGSPLIRIDDSEARMNLLAQRASLQTAITQMMPDLKLDYSENAPNWEQYLKDFDVNKHIPELPEVKDQKERYYLSTRNIFSQFFNIKSAEERLDKFTTYAPFSGIVTVSNIDPGTVIMTGQKLGEFLNPNSFELEASVSVSDLSYLSIGDKVALHSDLLNESWEGRVKRISDKIDPGTQTIRVFISVTGKTLKEGMYLHGKVAAGEFEKAVSVPRKLVDDNSVYVVEDSRLKQKQVKVLKVSEKEIILTGLETGEQLLNENIVGVFEGMEVKVAGAPGKSN